MSTSGTRGRRTFAVAVVALAMAAAVALPAQAATAPDTIIDSAPAALTTSASATVTFHATVTGATFTCRRDGGAASGCKSPFSMTKLSAGPHTLIVTATASGLADPSPATVAWVVDLVAPTVPSGVAVTTDGASNTVTWTASTDDVAVAGYDVFRGGVLVGSVGAVTSYTDSAVTNGAIYGYTVRARDTAGHASAQSTSSSVKVLAPYDQHLTRAPYLTDLVGNHVAINFATDQSASAASIVYGAVDGSGACTPATAVASTRTTIVVGPVTEYQWTSQVDVPSSGTYCYRVRLGATDLLGANSSPRFVTQVALGASTPFAFDVFGDWGQVPATPGEATDLSNLMTQMAASGARFAVSVGDNGYPNGNQVDYGDLQQASTSAIFSPRSWTVPGSTLPLFTAPGNHGLAGVTHADITTWTQSRVVSTSAGRYRNDVYCCLNGSASVNYGSEWYAFDVGNARFYVLDSAWGDTNGGTASPYANDALAHFAPGTPEYQWLLNDLQTHTPQLKFAFSHYPLYSDNPSQPSDTYLQGAANLEGMLGSNGVQLLFNGHAHIYQRNTASAAGMPITYVTGGGGGTPEPVGPCVVTNDAYAIGWSPTTLTGSACGRGRAPTSASALYHFLKVSVSGTSVTVSPTDSAGRTFDVQTYTFRVPPDTYLDSTPTVGTTSRVGDVRVPRERQPGDLRLLARRRDGDGLHEPDHLQRSRPEGAHVLGHGDGVEVQGRHACEVRVDRRLDAAIRSREPVRDHVVAVPGRPRLARLHRQHGSDGLRRVPRRQPLRVGRSGDRLLRHERARIQHPRLLRARTGRGRQRVRSGLSADRDDGSAARADRGRRVRERPGPVEPVRRTHGRDRHGPRRVAGGRGQHPERRHLRQARPPGRPVRGLVLPSCGSTSSAARAR